MPKNAIIIRQHDPDPIENVHPSQSTQENSTIDPSLYTVSEEEKYYFDLRGYLIVEGAISETEVKECNDAIDHYADEIETRENGQLAHGSSALEGTEGRRELHGMLGWPEPYRETFRKLLVHPTVVSHLNEFSGKGFRLDHGPQFIGGVKGTSGQAMHGSGDPHKPWVAYHHQDGEMYCGGVTVSWMLSDIPENMGGFACVLGSHKSSFPTPTGVTTCDDPMGTVIQPGLKAGDVVLFMDGAQAHGTFPWQNDHERRSILFKYAGRTSARSGPASELAPPETYWDNATIDGMTEEQKAVMWGPYSNHRDELPLLDIDKEGTVRVEQQE